MADPADIAGETLETCLADAEQRARGHSAPNAQPNFADWDGVHCVEEDCGVELPEARRAMKRCRCIDCQTRLERRK